MNTKPDPTEKKMRPGEVRCVPKETKQGRFTVWNVYDRARGSYPSLVSGFGKVEAGFKTEAECQTEADRLNAFYGAT